MTNMIKKNERWVYSVKNEKWRILFIELKEDKITIRWLNEKDAIIMGGWMKNMW